ncbi:rhodanese-like domain-containing protein [Pararhodospirillum photometricum]|uniref:Rhodanese-like protein n=1 Tax=Pararhodospirillum photometricum DSM 122 TaxID=1150469 RepID=H6SLJ7_PARPM|nr:rhodanese-like domain-containing protein [Pararhodospirillum photometricum]CCG08862.1 Rhodanese-like protein [Pararhodospirillum photometricum DSM 122]
MDKLNISWELLIPVAVGMVALLVIRVLPRMMGGGVPFVEPALVESWRNGGDDLLIIDVRNPDEYAGGHVPGALSMPIVDLQTRLLHLRASGELDDLRNTPVYLICASDARAAAGARMFKKAGFQRLAVIAGGLKRWQREGLPVET